MVLLTVLTALAGASTIVAGLMFVVGTVDLEEFDSASPRRHQGRLVVVRDRRRAGRPAESSSSSPTSTDAAQRCARPGQPASPRSGPRPTRDRPRQSAAETSDCEPRDAELLEQDVNAWSSLAYVVAGWCSVGGAPGPTAPSDARARRRLGRRRGRELAYHGTAGDFGQFLHDVPLVGALGIRGGLARRAAASVGPTRFARRVGAASPCRAAVGLAPDAINLAVGLAVGPIVVGSSIARVDRGPRPSGRPLLSLGGVAVGVWALGTPGPPRASRFVAPTARGLARAHRHRRDRWVDRAYAAADPDRAPRMFRRFTDRTIGLVARGLVLAFHRSVDVRWRDRLPLTARC